MNVPSGMLRGQRRFKMERKIKSLLRNEVEGEHLLISLGWRVNVLPWEESEGCCQMSTSGERGAQAPFHLCIPPFEQL